MGESEDAQCQQASNDQGPRAGIRVPNYVSRSPKTSKRCGCSGNTLNKPQILCINAHLTDRCPAKMTFSPPTLSLSCQALDSKRLPGDDASSKWLPWHCHDLRCAIRGGHHLHHQLGLGRGADVEPKRQSHASRARSRAIRQATSTRLSRGVVGAPRHTATSQTRKLRRFG